MPGSLASSVLNVENCANRISGWRAGQPAKAVASRTVAERLLILKLQERVLLAVPVGMMICADVLDSASCETVLEVCTVVADSGVCTPPANQAMEVVLVECSRGALPCFSFWST